MPCYNTGKYLCKCVESLTAQGFDNDEYEIICVDNAATDNTAELLKELSVEYPEVKVVTLPVNKCSGGAYNAGLEVAQGKYVLFVDSDDYLKEGAASQLVGVMEQEELEMLYFNLIPFCEDDYKGHISERMPYNSNFSECIPVCNGDVFLNKVLDQMSFYNLPVPAYRKLFLRSFLLKYSLFFTPTTLGTDFLHTMMSLKEVERISCICDKVYYYRYNPAGVSRVRVTKAKIEYALGNYSKAYKIIEASSFSPITKNTVLSWIKKTIQSYIGEIVELPRNDRKELLNGIEDKSFYIGISRSFIQKSCFTNYKFFNVCNTIIPRKLLKRL